ncbi:MULTISPECIES: DEAD/DEAH box helicase [unclassified Streptomyces]|uniref:DEAD/DEAH box helicase n=2 Tax=Streptomyces TaxID=1883 RepID=A0ABU2RUN1_9ACTN|nr:MULTISPECIES: DEAD/DEAH box helicase [unclassified Streptomyces]MDT0432545.1 DEAD/DEAH box helicase [Streptomyces sp. DSM 41770]MYR66284.1 DEAD/DEAH box helicase [Streptomyces sp. SID4939]MYT63356.1 DEAD/DEAH box helicase [Streptomyces sp. SID8357]MYT85606.1 DEAD/DEAH box helicase [Streptomyces sp. SID8360]MYU32798.1 DEAD/DEAH box helicase [Streptomyces sp. SID8358]
MSISSSDRTTLPENAEIVENVETDVVEIAEAVVASEAPADAVATTDAADAAPAEDAEPTVTFASLGLPEGIVRKLAQNGVTAPFPIQAATIPDALAGKDILGRGRTGSGKTLSFGLPTLAALAGGRTEKKKPRAIILTPTRELAMQVADALQPYGDVLGLKMKVVCGGTSMGNQIYALERGVDVLVATPGRLRDIINRGACSLEDVQVAVLDEADQMSDLGFLPEVTELLDQIPGGGQRMLFSATMENEIGTLVKRYLSNPVTHEVDSAQGNVSTMSHHVLVVKPKDKAPVTAAIAARKGRTIIFVRTQLGADRIAEQLIESGVKADALHGGMTQGARTRVLEDFKKGYVNALVATDVAARGIHVDGIDLVLNVDPAGDHKDYLHRSGRTARAGKSGVVVSLALPHQRRQIFRLMEDAGVDASRHIVQGAGVFEPEVAEITGARSLTEVQADSANNAAKQAEREAADLTKQLERVQRRAVELREEADRLVARAARERGDDPEAAVAEVAAEAEAALIAAVSVPEQPAARDDRRDDRGNFNRRDDRGGDRGGYRGGSDRVGERSGRPSGGSGYRGSNDRPSFRGSNDRRDDRPSGGFRSGGGDRRDDRGGRSFERRDNDRPAFRERRDDRPSGGFRSGGGDRRDDRGGRSFERRDNDRPAFNRDRRDERPSGGYRSGGGDRPFNRDRRDDRPSGGFRSGGNDRPTGRRDDHRGGTGTGTSTGSFGRRDDKPRWKRNG